MRSAWGDVATKGLADHLDSLLSQAAREEAGLAPAQRVCNRAYGAPLLHRLLPRIVLGLGCLATLRGKAMERLGANTRRRVQDRSQPQAHRPSQPHPDMACKG